MDFGFSEEQRLLQTPSVRLLDGAPPARAREMSTPDAHDAELHAQLAELGALGTLVPEAHGGNGLSFLDAMLIAEELSRAAAPGAFVATGVIAATALHESGNELLCKEACPRSPRSR